MLWVTTNQHMCAEQMRNAESLQVKERCRTLASQPLLKNSGRSSKMVLYVSLLLVQFHVPEVLLLLLCAAVRLEVETVKRTHSLLVQINPNLIIVILQRLWTSIIWTHSCVCQIVSRF